MTREEIQQQVLNCKANYILGEMATGVGKSKLALDKLMQWYNTNSKILIVIPRVVLIKNWLDEIHKWGYDDITNNITFSTYVSIPKQDTKWDIVIFDECFKGDTQILTERGYIPFTELLESDKVAQFTDTGNIEFVKPIRLIKKKHTGNLCKIHLGRGKYVYMTPNHNQVYRTKIKSGVSEWKVKPIDEMKFNHLNEIPVSGKGTGNNEELSTLERLLIAIQADGTLQRHQLNESVYSIQVTKDRKKLRLLNLLKDYNNYTTINGREEVDRYMVKVPKGDAKLLSTHFTINMGYNRAKSFIDEVLNWDGSYLQGNTRYYSSKVKENADFVAAVAVQAGYKVFQNIEEDNRRSSYSTIHRVYMRENTESVNTQRMTKEYIEYNDYVYCVEVPSHKIVVRSEGYTFISGNCHHLSQRCIDSIRLWKIKNSILLSATIKSELKYILQGIFTKLETIKVKTQDAISNEVLPEPTIILFPLHLQNTRVTHEIWKNPKGKTPVIETSWATRWHYWKQKVYKVRTFCTQEQYYDDLCDTIDWYKRKAMSGNKIFKNQWLHKCGERLKWLSDEKLNATKLILDHFRAHDKRILTFCASIEQSEKLGCSINSKSGTAYLNAFNEGKTNYISAVGMLDEGCNLVNCQIGIFNMLNSSNRLATQRIGRILRHPNPIIIIPYHKDTREEEIIKDMLEGYDKNLITTVTSLNSLNKLILNN